jgi:DNA repair protein RadC
MDLPLGSSGGATPAGDANQGVASHLAVALAGGSWRERLGPQTAAMPGPALGEGGPGGAPAAAVRAGHNGAHSGYWRYVQHATCLDADVLSAADVLELLLYFGGSGTKAGARAAQLLDRFGSLGAVITADPSKLGEVLDGGDDLAGVLLNVVRAAVKAIVREPLEDRPVIGSASALMDYLSVTMRHEAAEATRILFLDRKNALIKDEILHRGTIDHTPLYPREVVKRVIELGAAAIILVHNHPSGDPTPSQSDVDMTRQLAAALGTINVVLHDHVIVGRNREASLRKLGLL